VSVHAPAWCDDLALDTAAVVAGERAAPRAPDGWITLAVAGAHLRGQPLEHQLVDRHAVWLGTTRTATDHRLYALAGTVPPKPGLVKVAAAGGRPIEVDLWAVSPAAFGAFVHEVPAPLCIGKVELDDGRVVSGFTCEPRALDGAQDITEFGGWRAYRASLA
jgi:allophanate hydrolase